MKKLLSYCGLVDAEIRASDKDLPVQGHSLPRRYISAVKHCAESTKYVKALNILDSM